MKNSIYLHLGASALCLLVFARPGLATPTDGWITTKAKIALLTDGDVRDFSVHVDTIDRVVTLHGTVANEAEKAKAEKIAKGVEGVQRVRNLLQVVAPRQQNAVETADAVIKASVEKSLAEDPELRDSHVAVQSVNAGVVLLSGEAASLSAHLQAIENAWNVAGVRRVASEITSTDKLADAEIHRDRPAAPGATAGVSQTLSDSLVTTAVKLELLADSRTPGLDINVDTAAGRVTLFGTVPSATAKTAATEDANKVRGVKSVDNALQVVAEAKADTVAARDDETQQRAQERLTRAPGLTGAKVSVQVENGIARLTGTVSDEEERLLAAVTARGTAGVRAVKDDLQIASR